MDLKEGLRALKDRVTPFYLATAPTLFGPICERLGSHGWRQRPCRDGESGRQDPVIANGLVTRLQPGEGVQLWLMIKDPSPGGMRLRQMPLDMSFSEAFGVHRPHTYERPLPDVVRGNQILFMRRDEVEAAWAWIDSILGEWAQSGEVPRPCTAGTWRPAAAIALRARDGRTWADGQT